MNNLHIIIKTKLIFQIHRPTQGADSDMDLKER